MEMFLLWEFHALIVLRRPQNFYCYKGQFSTAKAKTQNLTATVRILTILSPVSAMLLYSKHFPIDLDKFFSTFNPLLFA